MKNQESWRPSKYVFERGLLKGSRDKNEVGIPSRLITDLVAAMYGARLPLYARGRLLDLGCGKVPLFVAYQKLVAETVCVDWGNSMHQNKFLDLEWDLTVKLPYDDASFDTIILSDVLEHIPTPELLCHEMTRLLRPGGHVLLNVPFYYWLHETPHDFYRYTEFALRRFMNLAGLELIELRSVGGAPEVVADIIAKCLFRVPRLGAWLAALMQATAAAVLRLQVGKRVSEATRDGFPFGYFLVARRPIAVAVDSLERSRQETNRD